MLIFFVICKNCIHYVHYVLIYTLISLSIYDNGVVMYKLNQAFNLLFIHYDILFSFFSPYTKVNVLPLLVCCVYTVSGPCTWPPV